LGFLVQYMHVGHKVSIEKEEEKEQEDEYK
jgi:hypothetical protein